MEGIFAHYDSPHQSKLKYLQVGWLPQTMNSYQHCLYNVLLFQ